MKMRPYLPLLVLHLLLTVPAWAQVTLRLDDASAVAGNGQSTFKLSIGGATATFSNNTAGNFNIVLAPAGGLLMPTAAAGSGFDLSFDQPVTLVSYAYNGSTNEIFSLPGSPGNMAVAGTDGNLIAFVNGPLSFAPGQVIAFDYVSPLGFFLRFSSFVLIVTIRSTATSTIAIPTLLPLAANRNQRAIATALDGLFKTGSSDLQTVYLLATVDPGNALDAMSPAALTFADGLGLATSRTISGIVADHLGSVRHGLSSPVVPALSLDLGREDLLADGAGLSSSGPVEMPDGWRIMARGLGEWLDENGTSSAVGFDSTTAGAILVFDHTWGVEAQDGSFTDALTLGMAGAYTTTDVDFDDSAGNADVQGYHVGPYLGIQMGGFHTDLSFLYGRNDYDVERRIAFLGVNRTADGDFEGDQYTTRFGVGHTWDAGTWSITPQGSLEYVRLDQDSFTESGAGALNLRVDSRAYDSFRSSVGGRWEGRYELGGPTLRPNVHAAWVHEFLDDDREVSARFAGTQGRFVVAGEEADRDRARMGAGVRLDFGKTVAGLLDYEAEFDGNDSTDHGVSGGVELRFR